MTKHSWRGGFCNYYFISARARWMLSSTGEKRRVKRRRSLIINSKERVSPERLMSRRARNILYTYRALPTHMHTLSLHIPSHYHRLHPRTPSPPSVFICMHTLPCVCINILYLSIYTRAFI